MRTTALDKETTALVALESTIADFRLFGVRIEHRDQPGITAGLEQDLDTSEWTLALSTENPPLPVLAEHVERLWQAFLTSDDCGEWWVEPAGECDGCDEHPLGDEWGPRRSLAMGLHDGDDQ